MNKCIWFVTPINIHALQEANSEQSHVSQIEQMVFLGQFWNDKNNDGNNFNMHIKHNQQSVWITNSVINMENWQLNIEFSLVRTTRRIASVSNLRTVGEKRKKW